MKMNKDISENITKENNTAKKEKPLKRKKLAIYKPDLECDLCTNPCFPSASFAGYALLFTHFF